MPAIDYRPFISAHYNADESTAASNLVDAKSGANLTRSGSPGVLSDGALNGARGLCSGFFPAGVGFNRTPTGGGVWDTRQASPGLFVRGTFMGWGRLHAGHGATQEFASQARLAGPANTRAWVLRGVQFFGPGSEEGPVFLGWNGTSFALSTGFNWTTPIPHDEWYFLGWSIDLATGIFVGYIRVPSIGSSAITIDPIPASLFPHTALDQNTFVGIDSGHSSGGNGFDVDHITWMKGYAVADAAEFGLFAQSPLVYPDGFDLSGGIPSTESPETSIYHYYHGRV